MGGAANLMPRIDQARSRLQSANNLLSEALELNVDDPWNRLVDHLIPVAREVGNPLADLATTVARNVGDPLEWGTEDALAGGLEHFLRSNQDPNDERLERTWDSPYIAEFKDKWVREHSQLIHEAADRYNLPSELVAGVIWQEAGVLPGIVDNATYQARKWLPIDIDPESPLNDIPGIGRIFGSPEETSFGEIQMQIRTAAELLGYENPENLSEAQEKEIIAKLEDPASSIDLAARYLAKLHENTSENFPDVDNQPQTMTDEEFVAVATQYNQGNLTLEQVNQNSGYGQSILDLRENTESLLE